MNDMECNGSQSRTVTRLQDLNDDVLREILDVIPTGRPWQQTLSQAELHGNAPTQKPPSDLVNFCSTCHRLRDLGTSYIFSAASLTPYSNGRQASSSLQLISRSPVASRWVRSFSIVLFHDVPPDFGRNLCAALQHLSAMHDLTLVLPEQSRPLVRTSLQHARLCLPQVKTLAFMPFDTGGHLFHFAGTVLSAFPGLTSLTVRKAFEEALPFFGLDERMREFLSLVCRIHLRNLQSLILQLSGTPSDYVSGFNIHLPNLTFLHLKDFHWAENKEEIAAKLPTSFPKLSYLHLGVKTISDDSQSWEYEREEAAEMLFGGQCKCLQKVCFDGTHDFTRERMSLATTYG
ncbi:hypothetical protein AC579_6251 [Pseudocercospora musae]|uniref:Uncharacterized protein n=1 Tax=Pseudocercospora musae TaxID=113226 RepID=A0A139IM89_9PEZI|nr:hypothetical protein AC579_6251 [Pseudocercospora musae]